jgi:putative DNA primase/helicase
MTLTLTSPTPLSGGSALPRLPAELKERTRWVAWSYATFPGDRKPRKLPISPSTGRPAKTNDPSTWGTFDEALARHAADGLSGIGFVFTAGDGYCGIDLDNCVTGATSLELKADAARIVSQVDSYAELSPSRTGVHIITRAKLAGRGRKRGGIEVYDRERYFTVTGEAIHGAGSPIAERQEEVNELYESLSPPKSAPPPGAEARRRRGPELPDADVIEAICASRYRAAFLALYHGDWRKRYSSQSEADLNLVGILATFVGANPSQIDRLFRGSRLFRPKWDEQRGGNTYGERTINLALGEQQ